MPVEYGNLSSDKIIDEPKQRDVSVTLSGTKHAFSFLPPDTLKIPLDMSNVDEGSYVFPITENMLKLPGNIAFVNATPDTIQVKIYQLMEQNMLVSPVTKGRVSLPFKLRKISVEPREVMVMMPGILNHENIRVVTQAVDLSSITQNTVITANIMLPKGMRLVNPDQSKARGG